ITIADLELGRLLVGCPAKVNINGFEMMAINLRNQSPSKINLTPRQMKNQFNIYKDKYKKVHTKSISTHCGLTNKDRKAGISTINENLKSMCTHYHVMNKLMEIKHLSTLGTRLMPKLTTNPQNHPLLSPNSFPNQKDRQ
ncbi:hypothetical protein VP01_575g1, partial [Puccinia sorghi]